MYGWFFISKLIDVICEFIYVVCEFIYVTCKFIYVALNSFMLRVNSFKLCRKKRNEKNFNKMEYIFDKMNQYVQRDKIYSAK